jgi:hypothetical protein
MNDMMQRSQASSSGCPLSQSHCFDAKCIFRWEGQNMKSISAILVGLITFNASVSLAQSSAYAPLGQAQRFTGVNGTVAFEDGKDSLEISNNLGGLAAGKSYDLYVLSSDCPTAAPLTAAKIEQLRKAASTARKLATLASTGNSQLLVKQLMVAEMMSKGVLLMQGNDPIDCATVSPTTFGPPPPPPTR